MIIIEEVPNEDVYDFTVQDNHNFFANEILVHNCGEQPLVSHGSCNLGPINLSNHVINAFYDSAEFDWKLFEQSVKVMVIALNKMIDISYFPLPEQLQEVDNKRAIGLGFTGLADAMVKLKIKYNSLEGIEFAERIMKTLSEVGYSTSADLAEVFGSFPVYDERILESYNISILPEYLKEKIKKTGLRNSRISTQAPCGTNSIFMNNCSSGIEPIFAIEYIRHIKQDDGTILDEVVENDAWNLYKDSEFYDGTKPDYFIETADLNSEDHINIQAVVQKWTCTSISKTINLPVDIDFNDFKDIYWSVYNRGLKGCTTYRPNSILGSVLEIKTEAKEEGIKAKEELNEFFEQWKGQEKGDVVQEDVELPSEYPMRGFKLTAENKKWYINLAFKDKYCTRPFAIFVSTNNRESAVDTFDAIDKLNDLGLRQGINPKLIEKNIKKMKGQSNVNKLCRCIGLLMRHNVKLLEIIKVLDEIKTITVGSFIFRLKKFLMNFIDEIPTNGIPCPECGEPISYRDGCSSCDHCMWSKCA